MESPFFPIAQYRRWCKMFSEGRLSNSKEGGPEAPVTAHKEVKINTVGVIVRDYRRITLRTLLEIT